MAYETHRRGWWLGGIALAAVMSAGAVVVGQTPAPAPAPAPALKGDQATTPGPCCAGRTMYGRGIHRGLGLGFALRGVDLNDAQWEQVHAVMQRHRDEFRTAADKTRQARQALSAASGAGASDENAIRAAASALGDAEGEMAILRAKVKGEVWDILTPEQRQKAEALQQQREQRFKQRLERRGQQRLQRQQG